MNPTTLKFIYNIKRKKGKMGDKVGGKNDGKMELKAEVKSHGGTHQNNAPLFENRYNYCTDHANYQNNAKDLYLKTPNLIFPKAKQRQNKHSNNSFNCESLNSQSFKTYKTPTKSSSDKVKDESKEREECYTHLMKSQEKLLQNRFFGISTIICMFA